MRHPGEERLILFHYEGGRRVSRHLADCLPCRDRLGEIQRLLAAVEAAPVPERGEDYGREVWRRLAPRLPRRPGPFWKGFRAAPRLGRNSGGGGSGGIAGRFWRGTRPPAATAAQARERILLVTVGTT
jgi:hypothetical protein